MEYWSVGVMECWSDVMVLTLKHFSNTPLFHFSCQKLCSNMKE
jgi:hypothetical protein